MKQSLKTWNNWLLIISIVTLTIIPLIVVKNSEFSGTDNKAQTLIKQIKPQYKTWVDPIIKPPGKEIEGLLFALQAGIGAGIMGYVIGFYKGKKEQKSSPILKHDSKN